MAKNDRKRATSKPAPARGKTQRGKKMTPAEERAAKRAAKQKERERAAKQKEREANKLAKQKERERAAKQKEREANKRARTSGKNAKKPARAVKGSRSRKSDQALGTVTVIGRSVRIIKGLLKSTSASEIVIVQKTGRTVNELRYPMKDVVSFTGNEGEKVVAEIFTHGSMSYSGNVEYLEDGLIQLTTEQGEVIIFNPLNVSGLEVKLSIPSDVELEEDEEEDDEDEDEDEEDEEDGEDDDSDEEDEDEEDEDEEDEDEEDDDSEEDEEDEEDDEDEDEDDDSEEDEEDEDEDDSEEDEEDEDEDEEDEDFEDDD